MCICKYRGNGNEICDWEGKTKAKGEKRINMELTGMEKRGKREVKTALCKKQ